MIFVSPNQYTLQRIQTKMFRNVYLLIKSVRSEIKTFAKIRRKKLFYRTWVGFQQQKKCKNSKVWPVFSFEAAPYCREQDLLKENEAFHCVICIQIFGKISQNVAKFEQFKGSILSKDMKSNVLGFARWAWSSKANRL